MFLTSTCVPVVVLNKSDKHRRGAYGRVKWLLPNSTQFYLFRFKFNANHANSTLIVGGSGDNEEEDSDMDCSEGPSMLVLTGPNYSGKSVLLKQIAVIVYLAHIGSFVPCDGAKIGLTDKILTRIATRESVSRAQSAFMIDLQQIALATSLATRRSLIIIDEFGKGTNAADGAGLACGVFEYFLSLEEERPKVLAATHFHEIFESGFLEERPELAFGHMEVRVDTKAEQYEDQVYSLITLFPWPVSLKLTWIREDHIFV